MNGKRCHEPPPGALSAAALHELQECRRKLAKISHDSGWSALAALSAQLAELCATSARQHNAPLQSVRAGMGHLPSDITARVLAFFGTSDLIRMRRVSSAMGRLARTELADEDRTRRFELEFPHELRSREEHMVRIENGATTGALGHVVDHMLRVLDSDRHPNPFLVRAVVAHVKVVAEHLGDVVMTCSELESVVPTTSMSILGVYALGRGCYTLGGLRVRSKRPWYRQIGGAGPEEDGPAAQQPAILSYWPAMGSWQIFDGHGVHSLYSKALCPLLASSTEVDQWRDYQQHDNRVPWLRAIPRRTHERAARAQALAVGDVVLTGHRDDGPMPDRLLPGGLFELQGGGATLRCGFPYYFNKVFRLWLRHTGACWVVSDMPEGDHGHVLLVYSMALTPDTIGPGIDGWRRPATEAEAGGDDGSGRVRCATPTFALRKDQAEQERQSNEAALRQLLEHGFREGELKCPTGHALEPFMCGPLDSSMFACDCCGPNRSNAMPVGMALAACHVCDYYICAPCVLELRTSGARLPPLAPPQTPQVT